MLSAPLIERWVRALSIPLLSALPPLAGAHSVPGFECATEVARARKTAGEGYSFQRHRRLGHELHGLLELKALESFVRALDVVAREEPPQVGRG